MRVASFHAAHDCGFHSARAAPCLGGRAKEAPRCPVPESISITVSNRRDERRRLRESGADGDDRRRNSAPSLSNSANSTDDDPAFSVTACAAVRRRALP